MTKRFDSGRSLLKYVDGPATSAGSGKRFFPGKTEGFDTPTGRVRLPLWSEWYALSKHDDLAQLEERPQLKRGGPWFGPRSRHWGS